MSDAGPRPKHDVAAVLLVGDVRASCEASRAGSRAPPADFFRLEYRLDARLARFPKPIVAVMHGVTMGGGLGAHASHRVVTERSAPARPEVRIGLAPDVGGPYLLGRAPGELGLHVALTGGRLGPAGALMCGLAAVVDRDPRRRPARRADVGRRDALRHFEPAPGGGLGFREDA